MLHHSPIIMTLIPHSVCGRWLWSPGKARTGGGIVYTDQPILSHGRKYRGETEPKLPFDRVSVSLPSKNLSYNFINEEHLHRGLCYNFISNPKFESDSWESINLSDYKTQDINDTFCLTFSQVSSLCIFTSSTKAFPPEPVSSASAR